MPVWIGSRWDAEANGSRSVICAASGYRILERNFRGAGVEIDLVAMDGETLVFVEVKTRRTAQTGMPQEAVNSYKQRHLRRAGEVYAQRRHVHDRPMRFDVVAILEDGIAGAISNF